MWLVVTVVATTLALTTLDVLRNSDGGSPTALRRAAFDGDEEQARRILAAHPEWIDLGGSTNTPIQPSASLWETVQIAFGKQAPPPSSPEGRREEEFREIEASGATALVHAVMQKRHGVVLMLLSAGAKVRVNSSYGEPLVVQVIINGNTNILAAFEERGALQFLTGTSLEGYLLHAAVHSKRVEMVGHLLQRVPHVLEVPNSAGGTPLWLAIADNRLDLVQFLTTNGANWAKVAAPNKSAMQFARERTTADPSSNATAVVTWLEGFTATNRSAIKQIP